MGPPKRSAASCGVSIVEGSPFIACRAPKEEIDRNGLSESERIPWNRTHGPVHTNVHDDDDNDDHL